MDFADEEPPRFAGLTGIDWMGWDSPGVSQLQEAPTGDADVLGCDIGADERFELWFHGRGSFPVNVSLDRLDAP